MAQRRSNTTLPPPEEGFTLPDGTVVPPSKASPFVAVEVPSNGEAQRLVVNTRRKLADMPALPKQMNSYAVVLCYTASGLSDDEISVATSLTVKQVQLLRNSPAYASLEAMVVETVKAQSAQNVADVLATGEMKAANSIVALVESPDDRVKLSASRELLHMRGHKAAEKFDVREHMTNVFRIEIVDKRDTSTPVIDMTADDADGGGS